MTVELWDWLEHLDYLVGAAFPEADEDALRRCGQAWADAATGLRSLVVDACGAGGQVAGALSGDTAAAFARSWAELSADGGYLPGLAALCDQIADACESVALDVEYAKLEYIAALTTLGITLSILIGSVWAGGVSALGVPGAIGAAQFTVRTLLTRLVAGIAAGVVFTTGLDALAQATQVLDGHRDAWDWSRTAASVVDGAVFGAVAGVAFAGAGRLAAAGRLPGGLGLLAAAGGTGAVGGVAVPLVHGQAPTGSGLLISTTSGLVAGLASSHGHPREAVADLARLDALEPNPAGRLSEVDTAPSIGRPDELTRLAGAGPDPVASIVDARPGGAAATPAMSVMDAGRRPADAVAGLTGGDLARRAQAADVGTVAVDRTGGAGTGDQRRDDTAGPPVVPSTSTAPTGVNDTNPAANGSPGTSTAKPATATAGATVTPTPSLVGDPEPITPAATRVRADPLTRGGSPTAVAATDSSPTPPGDPVMSTVSDHGRLATGEPAPGSVSDPAGGSGGPDRGYPAGTGSTGDPVGGAGPRARGDLPLDRLKDEAVTRIIQRATDAEPALRAVAHGVADEVGGRLVGLDHSVKSWESLRERLDRFNRGAGDSARSAAKRLAGVRDSIRFTMVFPDERYRAGAQAAIDSLLDRGLRPVSQLQRWDAPSGYRGLNTSWFHPGTGHSFELQLHTDTSFAAKSRAYSVYAQLRRLRETDPRYPELEAEQNRFYEGLPVPEGATEVGIPDDLIRHKPAPDPVLQSARSMDPLWIDVGSDHGHPVSDTEAVALVRDSAEPTPAGFSFYHAGDEMRDFAAVVDPVAGYLTLDVHGSPQGFLIGAAQLTPWQFARALEQGGFDLAGVRGIKLIACDTAAGGEASAAATLARALGMEVVAPDQPVWTSMDGDEIVSSPMLYEGNVVPRIPPDGHWRRFSPAGRELPMPGNRASS